MNLTTVENDIVTKLQTDITSNTPEIRSWPDSPDEYQLLHPHGAILVRYNGSTYSPPDPNSQKKIVQLRTVEWVMAIVQRSLKLTKGHQGIYGLIEEIRASLTGYTITGLSDASVLMPTGDSFTQESGGIWIFGAGYSFTFPEAES